MTAREVLARCGLTVSDDNKVSRRSTALLLIERYEELIARQQAEIAHLRLLLEGKDGF